MDRIAFTGHAGVGKTTSANYLVEHFGFTKLSFAGKLKEIARELFPDQFVGTEKPRKLFQDLGMKMRELDEDVWAKYVMRIVEKEPNKKYVIDDLRFLNESYYCKMYDFVIVKIVGPQRTVLSEIERRHQSELEIDEIEPDYIIENYGTLDELYSKLRLLATTRLP